MSKLVNIEEIKDKPNQDIEVQGGIEPIQPAPEGYVRIGAEHMTEELSKAEISALNEANVSQFLDATPDKNDKKMFLSLLYLYMRFIRDDYIKNNQLSLIDSEEHKEKIRNKVKELFDCIELSNKEEKEEEPWYPQSVEEIVKKFKADTGGELLVNQSNEIPYKYDYEIPIEIRFEVETELN